MPIRAIATSDTITRAAGGPYTRYAVQLGGVLHARWFGYALVTPGGNFSSLDIIIPSQQRGQADTVGLVIEGNSFIQGVGIRALGPLTFSAAAGKLKFASSLAITTPGLFIETPSATGGTLAAQANASENFNVPSVNVGATDLTYRVFATDGATGAATVSATKETRILVCVDFVKKAPFPTDQDVGKAVPKL